MDIKRMNNVARATAALADHLDGVEDSDIEAAIDAAVDSLRDGKSAAGAIYDGYDKARRRAKARRDFNETGMATSMHPTYTAVFGRLYEEQERKTHENNF